MHRGQVRVVVSLFTLALAAAPGLLAQEAPELQVWTLRDQGFIEGARLGLEVRTEFPSEPCDGDRLGVRVRLENHFQPGPGPYAASIENPVPGGASYEPGSATGGAVFDPATDTVSWDGFLDVGETKTVEFAFTLDAGLPPGILVLNQTLGTAGTGEIGIDFPLRVCGGSPFPVPQPPPSFGPWLSAPGLPGFEAKVGIFPADGGLGRLGEAEADCIAETLCVSGALPGRPELFIKVVGPRPNGFLWAQLSRFTPSRVRVWLRQTSTGLLRLYDLEAAGPAEDPSGLQDRQAFNP